MSIRAKLSVGTGLLAAALLMPVVSHADIMGSAYSVTESQATNAVIGSYGTPEATFTVPTSACSTSAQDLCFDSRTSSYTLGGFLAGGGATGITGSAGALASPLDNGTMGTILQFLGNITVTNGETFSIAHDDGLQFLIGSDMVVDMPGPTSPTTTMFTYTGTSGTYAFNLTYGECCGAPAVLDATLPLATAVPEPSTFALFAVGMMALGVAVTRRRWHRS